MFLFNLPPKNLLKTKRNSFVLQVKIAGITTAPTTISIIFKPKLNMDSSKYILTVNSFIRSIDNKETP